MACLVSIDREARDAMNTSITTTWRSTRGARILAILASGVLGCSGAAGSAGRPEAAAPHAGASAVSAAPALLVMIPPRGKDNDRLQGAIELMDAGHLAEAITALKGLQHRHPNNALVLHELGLALRLAKRPAEAVALWMPYRDRLPVDMLAGLASALDESGRGAEALALLREEVVRHPSSGLLYSELGTMLFGAGKRDEALASYKRGVQVEPTFPANYLHLAELSATRETWGHSLLYGEAFRLFEPTSARSNRIAKLMVEICNNAIKIEKKGKEIKVYMPLTSEPEGGTAELSLQHAFELAFYPGLLIAHTQGVNLASLHEARRVFFKVLKEGKPDHRALTSLPLVRWLMELDAAGHLEAYDYWLYGPADPETQARWFQAHRGELKSMTAYVSSHPVVGSPLAAGDGPMQTLVPQRSGAPPT